MTVTPMIVRPLTPAQIAGLRRICARNCWRCHGAGKVRRQAPGRGNVIRVEEETCPECEGRGRVHPREGQ